MKEPFLYWSGVVLLGLLFFSILVLWVPDRWAVSTFETGVFCLALVWMVRMIFRPYAIRGSILLVPLAAIALWGILQIATRQTVYNWATWNATLHWTTNLFVFLLCVQIARVREFGEWFRLALVYFGFAISIVSIFTFFTGTKEVFWTFPIPYDLRLLGPFLSRDHYAAFIELLLPLAFFEALQSPKRVALFTVISATMVASVIAGASRAGSILVVLEVATLLALAWSKRIISERKFVVIAAQLVMLIGAFGSVVGWTDLWNRFQNEDPFLYRREMLTSALAMVRERPVLGFGLGNFDTAYPAYAVFDIGLFVPDAHNDWAEWAAEGGVPFLVLVGIVWIWSLRPALQSLWGLGLISVGVHSWVDFHLHLPALAAWTFMLLGLLAGSKNTHRQNSNPNQRSQLKKQKGGPQR